MFVVYKNQLIKTRMSYYYILKPGYPWLISNESFSSNNELS